MGRATASFLAAGWLALAALGRAEMPDFSKTKPPPGRTFKTNQDKVNYALCQAGHKNTCAHVHYNEGPLPKKAASPAGGPPAGAPAAGASAARDPGSQGGPDAPGETEAAAPPPPAEAAAERARADGDKAMSRARGLGDALKKDLREAEGGPPGGAQPGRAPGGPPSDRDLLAAAYSGYGASLTALGLVVGRDAAGRPALLRADGSPATAEDLAALKARIAVEPEALMRRPDLFSVIPRARFEELKQAYRSRPELRDGVFRDIGLSASGRDFERAASCEKLSGACAPEARTSYRKGDAVPPEELAALHRRLRGGDPDEDFEDAGPGDEWESEAPAEGAAAPAPAEEAAAAPGSTKRTVLRALERLSGGDAEEQARSGGPGASAAARRAWGDVPGAAVAALERGRGRMSAAGAALLVVAVLLLSRRST